MHYKNGREAKVGDKIISVDPHMPACGILHSVNAGSNSCNGRVAATTSSDAYVTVGNCLHIDDAVVVLQSVQPVTGS